MLLPTVNRAPATGWAAGETLKAAAGLAVAPFGKDLEHPRWLYVLPNGDVLVAESNTPGTEPSKGVRGWAMGKLMSRAGARVPSPDRIVLLRDVDGDGVAEKKTVFLQRPDLVAKAVVPDYALGTHVAALGLAFVPSVRTGTQAQPEAQLPARFARGAFIGEHGSWNRKPRSGCEVVFVPSEQGKPTGMPVDVLTGFVSDDGKARGRPVGVAIDMHGALLVADDVGNVVWRVTGSTAQAAR